MWLPEPDHLDVEGFMWLCVSVHHENAFMRGRDMLDTCLCPPRGPSVSEGFPSSWTVVGGMWILKFPLWDAGEHRDRDSPEGPVLTEEGHYSTFGAGGRGERPCRGAATRAATAAPVGPSSIISHVSCADRHVPDRFGEQMCVCFVESKHTLRP